MSYAVVPKSKTDHENTKVRKHEIGTQESYFVFSYFRVFVILFICGSTAL